MKTLTERIRTFIQVLKPMSWKARVDHIFTYYKWIFVAFFCLLVAISIGVNAIVRHLNPPLYRGAAVGVQLTEQATDYLTQHLQEKLDSKDTQREAILRQISFLALDDPQAASTNQAAYYQLTALIAGQELEYAIMDENAWSLLKDGYFFADLQALLPPEELTRLQPYLQWVPEKETGKEAAIAIDISHLDFVKKHIKSPGSIYLAFPGNTENNHFTQAFIQHLWQFVN